MLVKCFQICAHVFIDRPQNCAQTSFRSCAGLRPNFGHSRSKLCPIMCRSCTKLCPNFGRSRARLCPISFAPCPFPNLAGTLIIRVAFLSAPDRRRRWVRRCRPRLRQPSLGATWLVRRAVEASTPPGRPATRRRASGTYRANVRCRVARLHMPRTAQ